jgi:hypothetical protein
MSEAPSEVIAGVTAALEEHGADHWRLEPISRFQGMKHGRYAFFAEAADGTRLKVRHLPSADAARELERLRAGLEPSFSPVLRRTGPVLVEAWIEGRELRGEDAERHAHEAGGLLARLHATPLEAPDRSASTSRYRETAEADLAQLHEAGDVEAEEAESLRAALRRLDPGSFPAALIHRDFCAENFILDGAGRLRVVDNEWLEVGAAGFDLGRTFHRWPMPREAWQRFLEGYRTVAAIPDALDFWMLASTLFGARVFARVSRPELPPLLELLRALRQDRAEPLW